MADQMYDVDAAPVAQGYGSVGAAAMYGLQREMFRRQQMEEQARQIARQQQIDALNEEHTRAQMRLADEQTAGQRELREAQTEGRRTANQKAEADLIANTVAPGTDITTNAELQKKIAANPYLAGGLRMQKAQAGTQPLAEGEVGPEMPATSASSTWDGTAAQQAAKVATDFTNAIADGTIKVDRTDPVQVEAVWKKMGGKGTIPAGILQEKQTPSEKMTEHTAAMMHLWAQDNLAKQGKATPLTDQERADLDVFRSTPAGQTQGEKTATTVNLIDKREADTEGRATTAYVRGLKNSFRQELTREDASLEKDLERVDRANAMLKSKNFAADAVAAPEFLQIVAGGMGSGLRMTDAELRRVNEAQNVYDQMQAKLAKLNPMNWGSGEGVTIQNSMRANMQKILNEVEAARKRRDALKNETLANMGKAKTEEEADGYHTAYWTRKTQVGSMNQDGKKQASPTKKSAADLIKQYGGGQ